MNDFPANEFNKETADAVYFFTPAFYALDNFSAYAITIWDRTFPTSEHAYQWKKYADTRPDLAEEILVATSPNQVKKIADAHRDAVPATFKQNNVAIMEEILRAKFDQHEKVRKTLRATGEKRVVENSPVDSFWGVGPDGVGENMLGKLWMKIRAEVS